MTTLPGSTEYRKLLDEMWETHTKKNAGYAGIDNPDRWANFRLSEDLGIPAWKGALIRLQDKFIRVTNLIKNTKNEQVGESIRDTLIDLSAYALIIVCLLDELENKKEKK